MTLAAGATLGPYEIRGPIGAGGMGEVFRARDTRLGRDVALKILPTTFATDQHRLRRFEQEARAAASLNHPNIVAVYDVGATNGVPYVVSELLEGQTLRQVLRGGTLTTRKAVDYGAQIATGLGAAHEKGIIHRDIKPENIFVTTDGRVKILDFGLAKVTDVEPSDGTRPTMTQTDPGTIVGTVGYMSPEQVRGEPVDPRTDVFSLGAVLYEMFSGERAFKKKSPLETVSAILNDDPADFPASVRAYTPAIERVVRRCLEKSAHERFQSVRDVTFALDALSNASGIKQIDGLDAPQLRSGVSVMQAIGIALVVGIGSAAPLWIVGRFHSASPKPAEITQLTFRSGNVRGARFAPDGQNVIYAAAWEGQPVKLFSTRPGSSDSTPLALPDGDLMAVSHATNELLGTMPATTGALSRASLSGGAPRALAEHVVAADFSPDGHAIAAIVATAEGYSLQFPIGNERVKLPYEMSHVRVAPDGEQVAFLSHPLSGDEGDVEVLGKTGEPRAISKGWITLGGLAWANGGKELWFTAARKGAIRALWAVTLDGRERALYRSTERLTLADVAPDGSALISAGSMRSRVYWGSLHDTADRDLSWFDFDNEPTVSGDGRLVAFTESGEGAGSTYGVFVRPANGGPAVRVVDGASGIISPDGTRVLAGDVDDLQMATLVPTGAGASKRIQLKPLEQIANWHWYPDSRHVVLTANEPGQKFRSWRLDTATGALQAITPLAIQGRVISPNGRFLVAEEETGRYLLDLQSGARAPINGMEPGERAVGFTADGSAIYVFQTDALGSGRVFQIEPVSGKRRLVRTLHPTEAGLLLVDTPRVSFDGDHFAYSITFMTSQLFLLKLQ
jgi:serine/threonine protein kinase